MARAWSWVSAAGAVLFLVSAAWLGALERGGPTHAELQLGGGVPATLYLPARSGGSEAAGREAFLDPPPREERPPGVVLMHGFSSDRAGTSTLARRLALAGYAVIALDAAGHGENRNPFPSSRARPDTFSAEIGAAVDFLRASPLVDGERIALAGHSMGAVASLDFATRDQGLDAAVMIAGGFSMQGPHSPPNALFIYAAGDPGFVKQRAATLGARLADLPDASALERGRRYGEFARRSAVRVLEVPGVDHATIVFSEAAAREIARWLDASFGRKPGPDALPDPRLRALGLLVLAMLLVLPGLGLLVGKLVASQPQRGPGSAVAGLLWLAGGLVVTMPLLAIDPPLAMLSLEVGDVVVSHFALTGVLLLAVLSLRGERPYADAWRAKRRLAAGIAIGVLGVALLFLPLGAAVHRMALTPERTLAFVAATLALLPFALAFQWLLRRGLPLRASLVCGLGRVLVLVVLLLGVATGLLSFVVVLMLPALVVVLAMSELLAGAVYARSRNLVAIAAIDAAWLALVVSAVMPIRA